MMRMRKVKYLLAVVTAAICIHANAQTEEVITDSISGDSIEVVMPWDEAVKQKLYDMADEAEQAYYTAAVSVYDLTADSLLFGYNDTKVVRPASTNKLLTGITALSTLGGTHEYRTRAYFTGEIDNDSTLNGDVYIVGDMDPTYTYDDLRELAGKLYGMGVRNIRGAILADISMKDSLLYGKGWCWDDVPSKYEPYLPALLFNRGQNAPESSKYSPNPHFRPWLHFVKTVGDVLAEYGVTALGEEGDTLEHIPYGTMAMPAKMKSVCFHTKITTIEQVLQRVMKNSDNLYAESLFWQLANYGGGRWCGYKDAVRIIESTIRKAGAPVNTVRIVDGSGVSLYNYHCSSTQIAMLRYAYQNESIFRYLYPALPIAGKDGTLSDRMKTGNTKYNVHAKTGTLEGVSSLAGYVTASNGHMLAFSIIMNGVLRNTTGHNYQDRLCNILAQ